MSKRIPTNTEQNSNNAKKSKHWSLGLLNAMKDPKLVVKSTKNLVMIRDKYPKAKIHYLILPHENISSIYKLNKTHVPLLQEFGLLYKQIQQEESCDIKAGFHAMPSMFRLHMHIISTDMVSPCLKTKVHWNSFTTRFFLPYEDVLKELEEYGSIKQISEDLHKNLMATELQCNQCSHKPKNMPQLKEHLLIHLTT